MRVDRPSSYDGPVTGAAQHADEAGGLLRHLQLIGEALIGEIDVLI